MRVPSAAAVSTTTPQSERLLANTLGYPKSWHVVRKALDDGTCFSDTIFSGDPNANADTYYNHAAAFDAALRWKEGESTPYDDAGGQMMSRVVNVALGDEVECLYDGDGEWYRAYITKITEYNDDVRYVSGSSFLLGTKTIYSNAVLIFECGNLIYVFYSHCLGILWSILKTVQRKLTSVKTKSVH